MGIINQIKYLLICILTVTIISCDSNDCPLNNVVYSTYGFYVNTADGEAKVSVMDTLTVVAAGTDSILINRMYEMSSMLFIQLILPFVYHGKDFHGIFPCKGF